MEANLTSKNYSKARYHYLLQIFKGETLAINYCKNIAEFAPTESSRSFLLKQQEDEERHLEHLTKYMEEIPHPRASVSIHMSELHAIMDGALKNKDYPISIFIQNFIVEGLVIIFLKELQKHGDEGLQAVAASIIADEVGHVHFGTTEIKRLLDENNDPTLRKRLANYQRRALFRAVLLFSDLARDARYLGIGWDNLAKETVADHLERIKESGFHMPWYDRALLYCATIFFSIV